MIEHTREVITSRPPAVKASRLPTLTPYVSRKLPSRELQARRAPVNADLIVMRVHGRNALDLMLFASTANQVVRRATYPVLTLRR